MTSGISLPVTILVTGSRDWPYRLMVEHAIDVIRLKCPKNSITVMHGGCPTGADAMAHSYAVSLGFEIDQHDADWNAHGRAAGPLRNREMVEKLKLSSQPVCTAFMLDNSRGTRGTLEMVQSAHLPWRLYGANRRNPGQVNYCDSQGRIAGFPVTFGGTFTTERAE